MPISTAEFGFWILLSVLMQTACFASPAGSRVGRDVRMVNLDHQPNGLSPQKTPVAGANGLAGFRHLAKRSADRPINRQNADEFWKRRDDVMGGFPPNPSSARANFFWKRDGSDSSSSHEGALQRDVHKRNPSNFWKRSGDDDDDKLMIAFLALREYLLAQEKKKNKSSTGGGSSWPKSREVTDGQSSGGLQASVQLPRQERRRQEPLVRPEFNPTGW